MCHMSCVTCHVLHVTCNFSFLILPRGGAICWRACYQRGLPRLVYKALELSVLRAWVDNRHTPVTLAHILLVAVSSEVV